MEDDLFSINSSQPPPQPPSPPPSPPPPPIPSTQQSSLPPQPGTALPLSSTLPVPLPSEPWKVISWPGICEVLFGDGAHYVPVFILSTFMCSLYGAFFWKPILHHLYITYISPICLWYHQSSTIMFNYSIVASASSSPVHTDKERIVQNYYKC